MQLIRVFHNICKTDLLRVIIAINRVALIVALVAHSTLPQLLHRFVVNHVRILVPQVLHNVIYELPSLPLEFSLHSVLFIVICTHLSCLDHF